MTNVGLTHKKLRPEKETDFSAHNVKKFDYEARTAVIGSIWDAVLVMSGLSILITIMLIGDTELLIAVLATIVISTVIPITFHYFCSKPNIIGEWLVDEEKGIIRRYRPTIANSTYEISNIERIVYKRRGNILIYLKDLADPLSHINFKIFPSQEKEFEMYMSHIAEKYGFKFEVVKRRRDKYEED